MTRLVTVLLALLSFTGCTLIDQRTAWQQRLQAQLFHQGAPAGLNLRSRAGRASPRQPGRAEIIRSCPARPG